jgi:hypothetical protein
VIEVILVALLAIHLLAIDVAMAGPLISVGMEWLATRRGDRQAELAAIGMARWSLLMLILGAALGGLLLAIRWQLDDRVFFSAVALIPSSRLWFALAELVFFAACMCVYLGLWTRWSKHRYFHRLIAVAASLNLLVHFPALFTIISVAGTRPETWGQVLDRAGYWRLLLDREVVSRVVHVWLSALVVGGIALMLVELRNATRSDRGPAALVVRCGAWLALGAALLQVPVGLWTTVELPDARQRQLLGEDLLASGMFLTSIVLALSLINGLASLALGDPQPKRVHRAAAVACTIVFSMTATRACLQPRSVTASGASASPASPGPGPLQTKRVLNPFPI